MRVQLDFDEEPPGFTRNAGGTSTFAGGILTIATRTYEEWMQKAGGFVATAGDPPGWTVEARLRLLEPCNRPGTGFWIHDGYHFVRVGITDHEVVVIDEGLRADIGSTSGFRTYRIELQGDSLAISVDGKQVLTAAALANDATIAFTFGVLGDGCAANSSAWDWVAYETYPAPLLAWPPDWHAGTTADLLLPAYAGHLAAPPSVADADVPCLALLALDGAVRDLLPLGYDQLPNTNAGNVLRHEKPVADASTIENLARRLHEWMSPRPEPVCDPAPGAPCDPRHPPPVPPSPAFAPTVVAALVAAAKWERHPALAYQATALAAKAYDEARAAHVPGADAAAKRLEARLAALATHPAHCGL